MAGNLEKLLHGLDILDTRGDLNLQVKGLCYDSRKTDTGDIFVAIRGVRHDASCFIQEAMARGARVVVGEAIPGNGTAGTFIRVPDSRKALSRLSANYFGHPSRSLNLIGVTGTNGKTTTTFILESILRSAGHSVGVLGTLAYRWGDTNIKAPMTTPESYDLQSMLSQMRDDKITHVVMEVSSHALALKRVEDCVFRIAIFTNLSQDHLDFHLRMEDYFQAKTLLFKNYLLSDTGAAVINRDDPFGERLIGVLSPGAWTYSLQGDDAKVVINKADLSPSGIKAELGTPFGTLKVSSTLIGRLNLYNILAAATAALAMGIPKDAIAIGLESVSSVDGRLQRVPVPKDLGFEVVVDYAHTPDAMEKSLTCLREMTANRLFVVFGCGGDRDKGKRPLMGEVAARFGDVVILTSDNPRSEVPESIISQIEPGVRSQGLSFFSSDGLPQTEKSYTVEADRKKAIHLALSLARKGDIVFIGGKGHETYQIIGAEVFPFDDREVVFNRLRSMELM